MDDTTILGGILNQLGQTAKQTVKQVVKLPEEMAADLGGQIGGAGQNSPEKKTENKSQWQSNEERINFLKGLYGQTEAPKVPVDTGTNLNQNSVANSGQNEKPTGFQEQIADKTPEEQKQLIELRNQLHKENYYDPTFNPVKKQDERPAEKVENEKKKEMIDLQEKEDKKPQPIAVIREQNKAEQFRGAAG